MKGQIIEKLRAVLSGGIDSECKVVYFLCECRKLLDHSRPQQFPFALRLYCNWALHVDLSRAETTLPFLRKVEELVPILLEGTSGAIENEGMLREFLWLSTFREQLRNFLESHGLPTVICDDTPVWHQFLTHYAGVIEEGSLSCSAQVPQLKLVDKVIFSKPRTKPSEGTISFSLGWKIVLLDGVTIDIEVNATPLTKEEPMIVNGFHSRPVQ